MLRGQARGGKRSRRVGPRTWRFWDVDPVPNQHWLDVGCGNGAFSQLLFDQTHARKVTSIDPSEGLLATARKRLSTQEAEFLQGDAQDLPFADNAFESAAMALVINFLPDPERAVREMARVTRPGGTIGSYIWDIEGGGFTMEPIRAALRTLGIDAPVTGPEKARLDYMERLWRKLGLEDIAATTIAFDLVFPDFDDFWSANTGIADLVSNAVRNLGQTDKAR